MGLGRQKFSIRKQILGCAWPGGLSVTKGADINGSGLELVISSVFSPGSGRDYVTGQIEFTAGRLRDTLTVRRIPIAEMFARSNVVLNSGDTDFCRDCRR